MQQKVNVVTGRSELGNYLGRITLGQYNESSVEFTLLTSSWYRTNFVPFVDFQQTAPFFFAWKPGTFPNDVGYVWTTEEPTPTIDNNTGRFSVSLSYRGIVE